ncbi:MAG: xanthine dehydrogenase iron-sulfur-binding subunit, partial [Ilumatobacteraceae bacterium]|nr:xanthine dehydrogenase iron-sulfur-binding subunit [Ilumatobacteraceae bacterium]
MADHPDPHDAPPVDRTDGDAARGRSGLGANEVYRLHVNGESRDVRDAWVGESLLYVLRERLGLMGSKGACEQGECG